MKFFILWNATRFIMRQHVFKHFWENSVSTIDLFQQLFLKNRILPLFLIKACCIKNSNFWHNFGFTKNTFILIFLHKQVNFQSAIQKVISVCIEDYYFVWLEQFHIALFDKSVFSIRSNKYWFFKIFIFCACFSVKYCEFFHTILIVNKNEFVYI